MDRQDQINAAYGDVVRGAKPDDFTAAGKVRADAIQAMLNLDPEVTAAERDTAMNAAENAKPAPMAPDGSANTPGAPASKSDLTRKAEALGVQLDPAWSVEKQAEVVAEAEERERKRLETTARLQKAADSRTAKAIATMETVECEVLEFGADKISTGIHIAGKGDLKYEAGEMVRLPKDSAQSYRARGWVRIA